MKPISLTATIAIILITFVTSVNAGVTIQNTHNHGNVHSGMVPSGKGWGEQPSNPVQAQSALAPLITGNGIDYHSGPVMLGRTNVYYIWYGNWSGNTATTILTDFAKNIGGSPYFNINTTYYDGNYQYVSNLVSLANSTTNNYSQGTALTDAQVQTVVSNAITSGTLPADTNGVYFVLTSVDVNETSGFCTSYCGWHTHGTISGLDIKYSFVGNSDRCPSSCAAQTQISPNSNVGADGMASTIAHELEETVTDPDLNAWFDSNIQENADKCVFTFGAEYQVANGANANMKLGTRDYLIQQNWLNASGGSCVRELAIVPPPPVGQWLPSILSVILDN